MIEDQFLPPCYMCDFTIRYSHEKHTPKLTRSNALCKLHRCYFFLMMQHRKLDDHAFPYYKQAGPGRQFTTPARMEKYIRMQWEDADIILKDL